MADSVGGAQMRLVDEVGGGLDGLSQLRALISSGRKPGILVALDFEFVEVEAGRAVFAGTPGARLQSNWRSAWRLCRHTTRLGLWQRRAFPSYGIAGLYDTGG